MENERNGGRDSDASQWKIPREKIDPNGELPEWAVMVQKIALSGTSFDALITRDGQLLLSHGTGSENHKQVLDAEVFMTIKKLVEDLWQEGAQSEYGGQEEIYRVVLLDGPNALAVQNIGKIFEQRSVAALFTYVVSLFHDA